MAEDSKMKIEKFNGTNYQWWRMQMEDILYQKDLDAPLGDMPADYDVDKWKRLDRKALATVRLCLSSSVGFNIAAETTTKGIMMRLAELYEQPSACNKVYLIKKMCRMLMAESDPVTEHLNRFNEIVRQMESVRLNFDDEMRALLFLGSLPDSWEGLVQAISGAAGKIPLKFADVVASIMGEEMRRCNRNEGASQAALSVEKSQSNRGRSTNKGDAKVRSRSKSKAKKKSGACWNCGEIGHMKSDCPKPKKAKALDQYANVLVTGDEEDELCLMASTSIMRADVWYMDSGASVHCTSRRDFFTEYRTGDFGHVTVGNGMKCDIIGKGDISLKMSNGSQLTLKEVRHIPDLKRNLISAGMLDRDGYHVIFGSNQWKVTKGSSVIAKGQKGESLYTFSGSCNGTMTLVAAEEGSSTLWHRRLGHLSESGMRQLHSKGLLKGIKDLVLEFCEDCVLGKQKRVSFNKDGREIKHEKLELVHSDV